MSLTPDKKLLGGSPGLVVLGDDSCLRGREFESQRLILDGHFSHWFVAKIVLFVWKDQKYTKRGRSWPVFLKKQFPSCENKNSQSLDIVWSQHINSYGTFTQSVIRGNLEISFLCIDADPLWNPHTRVKSEWALTRCGQTINIVSRVAGVAQWAERLLLAPKITSSILGSW